MKALGWQTRLLYAVLAGLAGWIAGIVVTIPFEIRVAWRYVNGNTGQMPVVFLKGMVVWSCFALLMAAVAWLPMAVPVALLVPPQWIVRWSRIAIPASGLAAVGLMGHRLRFFQPENFTSFAVAYRVFWTAPDVFAVTFACFLTGVYAILARRRLQHP